VNENMQHLLITSNLGAEANGSPSKVPKKLIMNGIAYVRSKKGNMILAKRHQNQRYLETNPFQNHIDQLIKSF
jgi:hypothetical protein